MLRISDRVHAAAGALIGTGVVLWTIGGEYFVDLDQAGRLLALRTDFIDWLVIILRTGYPPQMSPYAIGLGALMFATAFAAAYAVYRHHRVLDAILLLGAAMIVNMSATFTDLFGHLLLFVIAALLLWLRASSSGRTGGSAGASTRTSKCRRRSCAPASSSPPASGWPGSSPASRSRPR